MQCNYAYAYFSIYIFDSIIVCKYVIFKSGIRESEHHNMKKTSIGDFKTLWLTLLWNISINYLKYFQIQIIFFRLQLCSQKKYT